MTTVSPIRRVLHGELVRVFVPLLTAIVVLSAYTEWRKDHFVAWANLENILLQTSVLGVIAIGQTFLVAAGQLDLSVGSFAAYSAVLAATQVVGGRSELLAIVIVLLVAAGVGLVWGALVTLLRIPPFILTLGGLSIFQSLALVRAKNSPVPVRDSFEWLRTGDLFGLRTPIVILLLVLIIATLVMRYTRFGRQVYALGSAEEAAYLAGLPTRRTKVLVFVISTVLVSIAGLILMSRIGSGDPRSGTGLELRAIAAVVLGGASLAGGRGNPVGSFLGVFTLGVVQAALTFLNINDSWSDSVFGGVLVVAVLTTAVSDLRRAGRGGPTLRSRFFGSRGAATSPTQLAETTAIQQPQETT